MIELPDEVLLGIFKLLELDSIKAVRAVCRRWYEVSNDFTIWGEIPIRWDSTTITSTARKGLASCKFVRNIVIKPDNTEPVRSRLPNPLYEGFDSHEPQIGQSINTNEPESTWWFQMLGNLSLHKINFYGYALSAKGIKLMLQHPLVELNFFLKNEYYLSKHLLNAQEIDNLFAELAALDNPTLKVLKIGFHSVYDKHIECIKHIPLRVLVVRHTKLTPNCLKYLANMPLEYLDLRETNMNIAALNKYLLGWPNIVPTRWDP